MFARNKLNNHKGNTVIIYPLDYFHPFYSSTGAAFAALKAHLKKDLNP